MKRWDKELWCHKKDTFVTWWMCDVTKMTCDITKRTRDVTKRTCDVKKRTCAVTKGHVMSQKEHVTSQKRTRDVTKRTCDVMKWTYISLTYCTRWQRRLQFRRRCRRWGTFRTNGWVRLERRSLALEQVEQLFRSGSKS